MKRRVLIITGTRADYGLLRPVMRAMRKSRTIAPQWLVTGMHTLKRFGHTVREVKADGFPIGAVVPISERDNMVQAMAKEIAGIGRYLERKRPDLVFVLGDRDEQLTAAIAAGHHRIPVAHIRGGELTGPVVDEYNRHAITKFSHIHFTANGEARRRVVQMGEEPWRVFVVGATEYDEIPAMRLPPKRVLALRLGIPAASPWALVVHHPTPLDPVPSRDQVRPLFAELARRRDLAKIVIYPNADTGSAVFIREFERYRRQPDFRLFQNLPRREYLAILKAADFTIGNSSSGIVDVGYFKTPTVQVGDRQRGRERGANVIACRYDGRSIATAIRRVSSPAFRAVCRRARNPYGEGNASAEITRITEQFLSRREFLDKRFFERKDAKYG